MSCTVCGMWVWLHQKCGVPDIHEAVQPGGAVPAAECVLCHAALHCRLIAHPASASHLLGAAADVAGGALPAQHHHGCTAPGAPLAPAQMLGCHLGCVVVDVTV